MLWTCPGSLLIAGEYRITEEGGRGLAVAAGPVGRAFREPSEEPSVRSLWPGGGWEGQIITPEMLRGDSLAAAALREMPAADSSEIRASSSLKAPGPVFTITVDTTGFFREDGSKLGYGSSAAACILLCRSFAPTMETEKAAHAAIRAHRAWQGGRGSGYDVLASAFGGTGLFIGGREPSWDQLSWPVHLKTWIIHAPEAVRTPRAVSLYKQWRMECPDESEKLLSRSDELVNGLTRIFKTESESADTSVPEILRELSDIGRILGEKIGVPAEPVLPEGLTGILQDQTRKNIAAKCLGAGNETILLAALPDSLTKTEQAALDSAIDAGTATPLLLRKEGIRRESGL